jgi:hypothetical protein
MERTINKFVRICPLPTVLSVTTFVPDGDDLARVSGRRLFQGSDKGKRCQSDCQYCCGYERERKTITVAYTRLFAQIALGDLFCYPTVFFKNNIGHFSVFSVLYDAVIYIDYRCDDEKNA